MNHNKYEPQSAREIVSSTIRSDEFLVSKDTNKTLGGVALLAESSTQVAERQVKENKGYETPETLQRKLVGVLPEWLEQQRALDLHRDAMTRDEKRTALTSVVEFNHILRQMIDNEVYTTMPEVTTFIKEVLLMMRASPQVVQYAEQGARAVLDGMRHEIASESVISSLPDVYDARQGEGIDDEMRGIDIHAVYKGEEIALDIKSKQKSADDANAKAYRPDYVAVWSGFDWEDFGNRLVPPKEKIAKKREYWQNTLEQLHQEDRISIAI